MLGLAAPDARKLAHLLPGRAIRYKSGHPHSFALRAFHFYRWPRLRLR